MALALIAGLCAVASPADARHHSVALHHARTPTSHHAKFIHIPGPSTPEPATSASDSSTANSSSPNTSTLGTATAGTEAKPAEGVRSVLYLARRGDWSALRTTAAHASDPTVAALARWFTLADESSNASFDELDGFLKTNPGWPRQAAIQSLAEKRMPKTLDARAVLAWFKGREPETALGAVRLGEAEMAAGDRPRGADRIRRAWVNGSFDRATEFEILAAHGDLLTADVQDGRLAHLLYGGDKGSVQRQMVRASYQAVRKATIREALQNTPKRGIAEVAGLPDKLRDDPDVMFDTARAFRALGRTDDGRQLLRRTARLDTAVAAPDSLWWDELVLGTRDALKNRDYAAAYDLVSRHHLAPGTDFADAEFMAGWIALKYLSKPDVALNHFQTLAQNVTRPISVARAHYWMGRSFDALKKTREARAQYVIAAGKPFAFYGQLALARLEARPVLLLPPRRPVAISADALAKDGRAQAFRALAAVGARDLAREFAVRIAKDDIDEAKAAALVGLARKSGDPALALKVAKLAEYQDVVVDDALHPTDIPGARDALDSAPIPKAEVLAFIRQESEFDTGAVSTSGALGLMQLMPATAKQRAKSLGLAYSQARLTSDPGYNVRLGTMTFRAFFQAWQGSYVLAIASYNAGAGNVRKWIGTFGDPRDPSIDPVDWIESIPFAETRNYVQRVIENILVYRTRLAGGAQPLEIAKMLEPDATAVAQRSVTKPEIAQRSVTKPEPRSRPKRPHKMKRIRTMTAELR